MAFNKEQFIADLEAMSVLELRELVSALEEHFGVTAAAPVAVAAGPAAAEVEEKTEFDVILANAGDKKIGVIKEGASKEEAAEIKAKLEAAGATVEVK